MTNVDNFTKDGTIQQTIGDTIGLGGYTDDAYLTKPETCKAFNCSERTLQRMVERFEIPPPMALAGRKVWIAGKVKAWITDAA